MFTGIPNPRVLERETMQHESLRASDFRPLRPRTAIPAGRRHSPPRTPWAARVLGSPSPAACVAPPTPRALRAARRARMRATAPCHVPSLRSPTRGNTPHCCSLPLGARTCTPPPDAARSTRATPSAEPSGSPAESPMRCQRPESCVPLMGGAGWADPLPAMRAALRAETVLSKLLGERVQVLVVYGKHGPRVRSRARPTLSPWRR